MSKSKIPYEKKVEIARDYLEGRVGYTESLGRANNSKASFRYWVHQYQEKGSVGLLPSCKNHEYPEDINEKQLKSIYLGREVWSKSVENMDSAQLLSFASG